MDRARGFLIWAWAAFAVLPAFAGQPHDQAASPAQTSPTVVSQDPLMQQIRRRQLTHPNGGVTAVVRIASGQALELKVVDLDLQPSSGLKDAVISPPSSKALEGLKPHPGLMQRGEKPKKGRPIRKADEQLKSLDEQGLRQNWGDGSRAPEGSRRKPHSFAY